MDVCFLLAPPHIVYDGNLSASNSAAPFLIYPQPPGMMDEGQGPNGSLATFLREFGPFLLKNYKPKGIVVFSAHWETSDERLGKPLVHSTYKWREGLTVPWIVSDYGDDQPLLMDFFSFPKSASEDDRPLTYILTQQSTLALRARLQIKWRRHAIRTRRGVVQESMDDSLSDTLLYASIDFAR